MSQKILIYADIFSLVCAYDISGRMPMKLVILVEWGRKGSGVRVAEAGNSELMIGRRVRDTPYCITCNQISNQL